ncbi:MAG: M48 family metalloprotease [Planctomycetota bacterium]|jgi:heat shock protein HtpX
MIRTAVLLVALTMILIFIGNIVGGQTGMIVALVIGLAINFINYWFSSSIVLKVHGAKVLEPGELQWLQDDVRDMTERAGMPMPKVAYINKPAPNAFATGRNPKNAVVAVTQGLLDVCDRRQVKAVMGHELGHVRNRDMLTMTLVAGAVSAIGFLAMIARFSAFFGGRDGERNPLALIGVAILAPLMAMMVQMAISRTREYAADREGSELSGDPAGLAAALEALHNNIPNRPPVSTTGATAHMMIANPFFGMRGGLGALFSTHPDPNERIRRLREMAAGR